ncbi:hypothetical protein [Acetobacterium wieringae]|uniref:hypothetical protein n=1 Tax=Acetobacterium wieringae TaxID=52694 RepID=UPI0026EEFBC6|nr:hypothetical protein [Acetobacterium wieringae]
MGLLGLLIIILIIYLVFRNNGGCCKESPKPDQSLTLLKQRYIDGEIDEDQYKKMLEVLRS